MDNAYKIMSLIIQFAALILLFAIYNELHIPESEQKKIEKQFQNMRQFK